MLGGHDPSYALGKAACNGLIHLAVARTGSEREGHQGDRQRDSAAEFK